VSSRDRSAHSRLAEQPSERHLQRFAKLPAEKRAANTYGLDAYDFNPEKGELGTRRHGRWNAGGAV
jgi:hypothetical protein